jgi:protein-S-isoprenylcysteine O-methyltransferase Ste14
MMANLHKANNLLRKIKDVVSLTLLAIFVSLVLFWFAENRISLIFSLAAYGYPQNWGYVILNVIFFSLFILFIKFRRKAARLPASVYLAFLVALFVEMYGFALTWYIMIGFFGQSDAATLWYLLAGLTGENMFVSIFLGFLLPLSNIIVLIGMFLIIFGWRKIHRAKNQLVTTGIYGHVRHPQYLGFMLITLGMNVLWVTIPTLLLWPILVIVYYRLAKEEDKEMEKRFGEEYQKYKQIVPMFIPHLRTKNFSQKQI